MYFISDANFHRVIQEEDDGMTAGGRIIGYLHTPPVMVLSTEQLNFDELIRDFNEHVDQVTQCGCGYVLRSVIRLSIVSVHSYPSVATAVY